MARKLTAVFFILLILSAIGCGGNGNAPATRTAPMQPNAQLAQALPGLSSLPYPSSAVRRVSAASYELLGEPPVAQSSAGVASAPGLLMLDPAATTEGFAWAIFALNGFPTDHSIYPTEFNVTTDAGCWIAYSDYAKGHWDFYQATGSGGQTYTDGAQLISPAGVHYVAVIAVSPVSCTVTSLQVSTSADLPTAPTAVLNAPAQVLQGAPADFTALGSSPGSGAFASIIYNWGDGTPETNAGADPATVVQHTFAEAGPQTVRLTVTSDQALSDTDEKQLNAIAAMRELLLVYNADIPEDLDLANYYASPVTGRAIDPAYILGIHPAAEGDPEVITWANYLSTIRDPIKAYLDANTTIKNDIKYILLCKGVPHKITGGGGGFGLLVPTDPNSPLYSSIAFASVDSDLCLLYNDYDPVGCMYSGTAADYMGFSESGFYLKGSTAFTPNTYKVSWVDYSDTTAPYTILQYTLNYLVGRLSAYSYDNVKQMIDRALNADTTGTGSIVFDSSDQTFGSSPQKNLDTMVDPVWPWSSDAAQKSGYELLDEAGFAVFADVTSLRLTGVASDNIPIPIDKVIGYAGWGVNHAGGGYANGGNYILKDLLFTYLPGACWISYESFNGRTFTTGNIADPSHDSQGIIADFLYKGGTVAIGNAWEPYTIGCGDERWVFDRYIHQGDRWIEAAYKGLRLLSWQEVVVGDPLCKVK